ncbi:MAG: hypothetical protein BGO07_04205 [Alphaproteobacteria bacterium 40-19]|nr:MAG: hypothetical protein BGO07_04205 [Alphaproteobacteria bacterium 40-19]
MFRDFLDCDYDAKSLLSFRMKIVIYFLSLGFLTIIIRLSWVSLGYLDLRSGTLEKDCIFRSPILDRHGLLLASSVPAFSLGARLGIVKNKTQTALEIHQTLPFLSQTDLLKKLSSPKKFTWLARKLSPADKMKVQALGIEGLEFIEEQKRVYPYGSLCCHILGLTDSEQEGISGIEKSLNHKLKISGQSIHLSVDVRLQNALRHEMEQWLQEYQATAGNAILANLQTGEILAMVSLPDFDPQSPCSNPLAFFNRNTSGVYEFGSILKIHNVALFLDSNQGTLSTIFDASKPLSIGRFLVTDFRGQNRPMSVAEGFLYSSNIVNGKMALAVGGQKQLAFFKKIGFFHPVRTELPEFARPLMPARWSQAQSITASYGYGFAITPLHIIQSLQMLITGFYQPLTLLKKPTTTQSSPALCMDPKISQSLIHLLEKAVLEGQAKNAGTSYCKVGAKTGTANMLVGRRYQKNNNRTSCVVIFPIHKPKYVLLVTVDQAKPSAKTHHFATAGWVAAPLARRIVEKVVSFLALEDPLLR